MYKKYRIIFGIIILICSMLYLLYAIFNSNNFNSETNLFKSKKILLQKIHFDKYLIYGDKNKTKNRSTHQVLVYIHGVANISIDSKNLYIDQEKKVAIYHTKDINYPFDVEVSLAEKDMTIVDTIYSKKSHKSESIILAGINIEEDFTKEGFSIKKKNELISKAEELLSTSFRQDKRVLLTYKKALDAIIMARALELGIEIDEVQYEKHR